MSDSQQQGGAEPETAAPQAAAPQAVPAVGFLVAAFTDENAADEALNAMKDAKNAQEFYFEDAAVIRQDAKGKAHYHETGDMSTSKGAGIGALVGGVFGVLGGPAGVVAGAAVGGAIGGTMAAPDKGFKNENLKTIGLALMPGTSAVVVITSHDFLKAMQQQVAIEDIRTTVSNLAAELSAQLAAGNDVAIGLLLTPDGLAIKEIAANADSAQVVGAVITADAVVVGAAVATADGAAYEVAGATAAGAAMEAGVVTDEGAVVVDAVAPAAAATAAPAADAAPGAAAPEAAKS